MNPVLGSCPPHPDNVPLRIRGIKGVTEKPRFGHWDFGHLILFRPVLSLPKELGAWCLEFPPLGVASSGFPSFGASAPSQNASL